MPLFLKRGRVDSVSDCVVAASMVRSQMPWTVAEVHLWVSYNDGSPVEL